MRKRERGGEGKRSNEGENEMNERCVRWAR